MRHAARYVVQMSACPFCSLDGVQISLVNMPEVHITIVDLIFVRTAAVVNAMCLRCRTPFCPFDLVANRGMIVACGVGMTMPFFSTCLHDLCKDGVAVGRTAMRLIQQAVRAQHTGSRATGDTHHEVCHTPLLHPTPALICDH